MFIIEWFIDYSHDQCVNRAFTSHSLRPNPTSHKTYRNLQDLDFYLDLQIKIQDASKHSHSNITATLTSLIYFIKIHFLHLDLCIYSKPKQPSKCGGKMWCVKSVFCFILLKNQPTKQPTNEGTYRIYDIKYNVLCKTVNKPNNNASMSFSKNTNSKIV